MARRVDLVHSSFPVGVRERTFRRCSPTPASRCLTFERPWPANLKSCCSQPTEPCRPRATLTSQRHAVAQADAAGAAAGQAGVSRAALTLGDAVGRGRPCLRRAKTVAQREAADGAQVEAAGDDAAAGAVGLAEVHAPTARRPTLSVTMLPAGEAVRRGAARAGQARHVATRGTVRRPADGQVDEALACLGAGIPDLPRQAGLRRLRAGTHGDPERRQGDGAMAECTKGGGHLSIPVERVAGGRMATSGNHRATTAGAYAASCPPRASPQAALGHGRCHEIVPACGHARLLAQPNPGRKATMSAPVSLRLPATPKLARAQAAVRRWPRTATPMPSWRGWASRWSRATASTCCRTARAPTRRCSRPSTTRATTSTSRATSSRPRAPARSSRAGSSRAPRPACASTCSTTASARSARPRATSTTCAPTASTCASTTRCAGSATCSAARCTCATTAS